MNITNRLERDIYNNTEPKARTYKQFMSAVHKLRRENTDLKVNRLYIEDITNLVRTPVKPYNKYIVDDYGRECTICKLYKEWEEYYNSPYGKQSYCKQCAKENNQIRKQKKAEENLKKIDS